LANLTREMQEMGTQIQEPRGALLSTPPALPGLPILGHALEFRRDPAQLFRDGYRQLGPIFSIRLGPQHAAVVLGPESNRFFFTETDRFLSMREVYRFLVPMFGEEFLFQASEEGYHEQRAILLPAFSAHTSRIPRSRSC
jgi:sterol 14alpha-demethylase